MQDRYGHNWARLYKYGAGPIQTFINVEVNKEPVNMISPKCIVIVMLMCYASGILCKPTESKSIYLYNYNNHTYQRHGCYPKKR